MKNTNVLIKEAKCTPSKINAKSSTPRHTIIKLSKAKKKKKRILRAEREIIHHVQGILSKINS